MSASCSFLLRTFGVEATELYQLLLMLRPDHVAGVRIQMLTQAGHLTGIVFTWVVNCFKNLNHVICNATAGKTHAHF